MHVKFLNYTKCKVKKTKDQQLYESLSSRSGSSSFLGTQDKCTKRIRRLNRDERPFYFISSEWNKRDSDWILKVE